MRRLPRHSGEALTGTPRLWLRKLLAERRPQALGSVYPRVANRIAWRWRDPVLLDCKAGAEPATGTLDVLLHRSAAALSVTSGPAGQPATRSRAPLACQ